MSTAALLRSAGKVARLLHDALVAGDSEQIDLTAQPSLDRRLVEDRATLRFIEDKANVLLIGPPGRGRQCTFLLRE